MPMLSWGVGIRVWEESRPMDSQGWGGGWVGDGLLGPTTISCSGGSGIGQGGVLTADSG